MPATGPNALGNFLKDRRGKIDPASLGYSMSRRRTPGLRREEVALLANVSPAWYTWLEQGRGGTPSADVLDRLARGLGLTEAEREHLFFLAQNRPPEARAPEEGNETEAVSPLLQHVLDSLQFSPASIRTAAWDVLAANRAARVVHGYEGEERYNILEAFFRRLEAGVWAGEATVEQLARVVVAQFRADAFRAGYGARVQQVVEGLSLGSGLFRRLWNDQEVDLRGAPVKTFVLPGDKELRLESTTFSVDGRPGLKLVIFTPVTAEDREQVRRLMQESPNP